eukprot:scaffold37146_cov67-Phaeocystis_antarctica.AAC.3
MHTGHKSQHMHCHWCLDQHAAAANVPKRAEARFRAVPSEKQETHPQSKKRTRVGSQPTKFCITGALKPLNG